MVLPLSWPCHEGHVAHSGGCLRLSDQAQPPPPPAALYTEGAHTQYIKEMSHKCKQCEYAFSEVAAIWGSVSGVGPHHCHSGWFAHPQFSEVCILSLNVKLIGP